MALKYQIFVSSTYEDLKLERDRVIQGILELGHIPVGMEMFSAADEAQWQIIARNIRESDYYVVILAHRYGSRDGAMSFTRKEYEYAVAQGIPVIGFVIDPEASWPADRIDRDADSMALLEDFRAVVKGKPVGFWSSADDLYGKASVALVKAMTTQPRVGWVRATSALGPEVTAEISRLSSENAELRAKLQLLEQQSEQDSAAELVELWSQMRRRKWSYVARFDRAEGWEDAEPITYSELFSILAPSMVVEASVDLIADLIAVHSARVGQKRSPEKTPEAIPLNDRNALLADYMMLDLMAPSDRRHPVADKTEYWSLTPRGQDLLRSRKRAVFAHDEATDTTPAEDGND